MATSLTLIATPCTAPRSSSSFALAPRLPPRCSNATAARRRAVRATTLQSDQEPAGSGDSGATTTKLSASTSVRQERWEGDLPIEGCLPPWLNGTYIRNGPGMWDVGEHAFHHLFDGYATLVRVSFRGGVVRAPRGRTGRSSRRRTGPPWRAAARSSASSPTAPRRPRACSTASAISSASSPAPRSPTTPTAPCCRSATAG
ncbi:hypothetical protein EE612_003533 [Oryza sativa]|nr:hypothetical protein EE612_003533 [Oryza sativa]